VAASVEGAAHRLLHHIAGAHVYAHPPLSQRGRSSDASGNIWNGIVRVNNGINIGVAAASGIMLWRQNSIAAAALKMAIDKMAGGASGRQAAAASARQATSKKKKKTSYRDKQSQHNAHRAKQIIALANMNA